MSRAKLIIVVFFLIALVCTNLLAAQLSPKQILEAADRARGNLAGIQWSVHVHSIEKGRTEDRTMKILARGYNFLAIMTKPAKVRGQKLLMVDRNMWFAKPGLRKPVPISPRQRLVGGIAYGDIASTDYAEEYEPETVTDGTVAGKDCYVFDLKAKDKKATYDRIKYWISKKDLLGIKAYYFTVSGRLLKSATFEYTNRIRSGDTFQPFISKMVVIESLVENSRGTLLFSDPKLKKVPDSALDVNLLMVR